MSEHGSFGKMAKLVGGRLVEMTAEEVKQYRKSRGTPQVGEIVHYTAPGSGDGVYPVVCRAAIVTETLDDGGSWGLVNLMVINPTGVHFRLDVRHDAGDPADTAKGSRCHGASRTYAPYHWHRPEIVD